MEIEEILNDRVLWKICESVHLQIATVYLPESPDPSGTMFEGVRAFYAVPERISASTLRFTITVECERYVRYQVLPQLPSKWWLLPRAWMEVA